MRKYAFVLFAAVFLLSFQLVYALDPEDLERSGSIRIRPDFASNMGDFFDEVTGPPALGTDDEGTFFPYRIRLALGMSLPRDIMAFIEIDTESDDGNVFGSSLPGPDENDLDFYQAYIKLGNFFNAPLDVTFGRQEMTFGDEFLFGDDDFYDGLAWDGVRIDFDAGNGHWSLFGMQVTETAAPTTSQLGLVGVDDNNDRIVWGGYTTWDLAMDAALDLYAYMDNDNSDMPLYDDVLTIGGRLARDPGDGFDYKAELAWQAGDEESTGVERDSSAIAFDGRVGYTMDRHWFALMYTLFEGDDNPNDSDFDWFKTPWQDDHGRFGNMDVLKWSSLGLTTGGQKRQAFWERSWASVGGPPGTATWGVNIIQLRYAMLMNDQWDWGVNLIRFDADADAPAFEDEIGNELDVYVNHAYSENLAFTLNLSFFSAGDFLDDAALADLANDGLPNEAPSSLVPARTPDDAARVYLNTVVTF